LPERRGFKEKFNRIETRVKRMASFSLPKIPPGIFLRNCFKTEAIVLTEKL
jgi:hypothetical protein